MQFSKLKGKNKKDYQWSRGVAKLVFKLMTEDPSLTTYEARSIAFKTLSGSQKKKRTSRRKEKQRHRGSKKEWVFIGRVAIVRWTSMAFLAVVPDGRELWIPRASVRDGNMRFTVGQIVKVWAEKWYVEREKIAGVNPEDASEATKTTKHNPYPSESTF